MDKKRIHSMLEKMTEWVESEMTSKGKEHIDTKEMGEAIDMVKDLAEAEMYVWKKCYYESIVKAMEEEDKKDELMLKMMVEEHGEAEGRAGYDRWRNSKGRFAPKGTGHETSMAMATGRMGYDPGTVMEDRPWPLWHVEPPVVMGYNGDGAGSNDGRSGNDPAQHSGAASRMGYDRMGDGTMVHDTTGRGNRYSSYDNARRHYHESGSPEHKREMSDKGREYVDEAIISMRDIFQEAEPQMQQKMIKDLANLYREFGGK